MSEYSQELRVFVIGCPSATPVVQKLMAKINEAADKFDALQKQRDVLLAANKILIQQRDNAQKQRDDLLAASKRGYQRLLELGQTDSYRTLKIIKQTIANAEKV